MTTPSKVHDPDRGIQFSATREEFELICKITKRALEHPDRVHFGEDLSKATITLSMDLEVAHSNGNPLNFEKLLAFKDSDFWHDIAGIQRHIDRQDTGQLSGGFAPRCSLPEPQADGAEDDEIVPESCDADDDDSFSDTLTGGIDADVD